MTRRPGASRDSAIPTICFAGGGTGGHLYPVISLCEAFRRALGEVRFQFLTTERAIDARILGNSEAAQGASVVSQPVQPLPSSPLGVIRFIDAWRASTTMARRLFEAHPPAVVIGSGGFGSGPGIRVARRMGIPTGLLNPDATPGKANRFLARYADVIFTQWASSAAAFSSKANVIDAGCPIRADMAPIDRTVAAWQFDLEPSRNTLLVTGASQGARSINEAVVACLREPSRFDGWQILHLTGDAEFAGVEAAYAASSVRARVISYTSEMGAALSLADLVVSRAGASTLAELTAMGTPSILMPYPYHRDRHQFANAGALADAGAAVLLEDRISADENAPRLGPILTELMTNDAKRDSMAAAAQAMSKPEAADTVVSYWLTEGVVERGRSRESPLRNPVNGENGARATMMRAGVAIDPGESVVPIHNAE